MEDKANIVLANRLKGTSLKCHSHLIDEWLVFLRQSFSSHGLIILAKEACMRWLGGCRLVAWA
jgi:hypothetical protein